LDSVPVETRNEGELINNERQLLTTDTVKHENGEPHQQEQVLQPEQRQKDETNQNVSLSAAVLPAPDKELSATSGISSSDLKAIPDDNQSSTNVKTDPSVLHLSNGDTTISKEKLDSARVTNTPSEKTSETSCSHKEDGKIDTSKATVGKVIEVVESQPLTASITSTDKPQT